MKKIRILLFLLILLTGCTTATKPTQPINHNSSCSEVQQEINRLKKKKHISIANTTAVLIMGGYGYGNRDEQIDEKIKVLEMKLLECR